jgi:hypothetical protein
MEQTKASEDEKRKISNLIQSSDDQNKKLGINLARSLKLESKDILEMIMRTGWRVRKTLNVFDTKLRFLNLKFIIVNYPNSIKEDDRRINLKIYLNNAIFIKKQVRFNCLGKNEIFIQQTIQLLIDKIKTI